MAAAGTGTPTASSPPERAGLPQRAGTAPELAGCPLQFIRVDDNGHCHVQEEAASLLSSLESVAVVGIAGLYRTGKSFLLNSLLGSQDAFATAPTVNPCTQGLWIWSQGVQPADSSQLPCIFLDTEGLGSARRSQTCDLHIFSLCLLLSSYFIYNSVGAIDESALEDLHLVLQVAQHIYKKSGDDREASEIAPYFPSFLWVVRDFHLRLQNEAEEEITERDYLERALRPAARAEAHNEIRQAVKELFRERDCATLVRPVTEEEELRHLSQLPLEALRPKFQAQVNDLRQKVFSSLAPKMVDGVPLTGAMLVQFAREYCEAINRNTLPAIKAAWTSVVEASLRDAVKRALHVYRGEMESQAALLLPLSEEALQQVHKSAKLAALEVFESLRFPEATPALLSSRAEFGRRKKEIYRDLQERNALASRASCQKQAEELYAEIVEWKLNTRGFYQSVEDLMADWETLQRLYAERTMGPAQMSVLTASLLPRMKLSVQRFCEDRRRAEAEDAAPKGCGPQLRSKLRRRAAQHL